MEYKIKKLFFVFNVIMLSGLVLSCSSENDFEGLAKQQAD